MQPWYVIVLEVFLVLVIVQVTFIIIFENRNPYKTISWILVLTFLPIVGLVLYLLFGQEHRKQHRIPLKMYEGLKDGYITDFNISSSGPHPEEYKKLIHMLKTISDADLLAGNRVDFYIDGKDKFKQFFKDIENARHHVHILYYKIMDDKLGNQLKDLLLKKVKEGVEVRLMYDDVGSLATKSKFFNEMKAGGIEVEPFLEVKMPWLARRLNYRNHKKLAVIDGEIGYVGGMNIADNYIEGVSWGIWRDMQIRIEGEGTKGLQRVFFLDWYSMHKSLPDLLLYFPKTEKQGNNPMQIVSSGPIDKYNSIEKGIFEAINGARKSIYIQTPYFIPSEIVLTALQTAAVSGVEVHVMIPVKSDNFFVDGATFSFVRDLLRYDIHVYLFRAGFIHTKCMVVDDSLTIVGSANMDTRSFELSFETDAFIYDSESAGKALQIFRDDASVSEKIDKDNWMKRSVFRRFFESVMRMFTPLL
ncbi:cardiolipin synthase [Bacteroidales bacterium OttesenSCG-928-A17]|nr:cardiolipin synthase [Bacteroidales bacterium OttesenSCG-928-A17]